MDTPALAAVNGIELAYQLGGDGTPLVLLTHHTLAVLPRITHYDIAVSGALATSVATFLDGRQG
ncbi:MAG: hypothetical protein ACXVEI_04675 [Actinomycetota bacterium]